MDSSEISKPARGFSWLNRANRTTFALFLFIAASLIGSIYLIYRTVEAERQERAQVQLTSDILFELRNISRAAINGEAGQRGYYITLDRRYLAPYKVGRETYRPALDRLDKLLGARRDQRQDQIFQQIETAADAKFAELSGSVALIERGALLDARRGILSDDGREAMEGLRRNIREMEAIENRILAASLAQTASEEARVLPLLAGLFVLILAALVAGLGQATRAARAEAIAANAEMLGEARDRADLLARELNHRVKNIFAVILAIVQMSGRGTPAAKPVIERISQRIHALLTAHEVTQGGAGKAGGELTALIETSFAPFRSDARRYTLGGPEVRLAPKQVTPLGLVLHELTTNAVKYGAWANGGRVDVVWQIEDGQLDLKWQEYCPEPCKPAEHEGFGTMLMTGAARQLQGSIDREFTADGAFVRICFVIAE